MVNQMISSSTQSDERADESLKFNHRPHFSVTLLIVYDLLQVIGIIYICISLVAHGMVLLLKMA